MHVYSIYAFCLLMLPPRGIVLSQCGCHHSFMPVAFFMLPPTGIGADVLPKIVPFLYFWKLWKPVSGFNLVIDWPIFGNLRLSLGACSNFLLSFQEIIPLADWSKINLCQWFCFLHLFCCLPLLAHSDHLCIFRVRCMVMVRMWAGSCVGVHGFLSVVWSGCWSLDVLGACLQCHFCGVGVGLCLVFWVWGLFMVCFSCLIVVWVVAWGLVMGCCVVCVSSSVFVVCAIVVFRFLVSPILVNHFCCCAISFDCCCSF